MECEILSSEFGVKRSKNSELFIPKSTFPACGRKAKSEIENDVSQTFKKEAGGLVGSIIRLLDHEDLGLDHKGGSDQSRNAGISLGKRDPVHYRLLAWKASDDAPQL